MLLFKEQNLVFKVNKKFSTTTLHIKTAYKALESECLVVRMYHPEHEHD